MYVKCAGIGAQNERRPQALRPRLRRLDRATERKPVLASRGPSHPHRQPNGASVPPAQKPVSHQG